MLSFYVLRSGHCVCAPGYCQINGLCYRKQGILHARVVPINKEKPQPFNAIQRDQGNQYGEANVMWAIFFLVAPEFTINFGTNHLREASRHSIVFWARLDVNWFLQKAKVPAPRGDCPRILRRWWSSFCLQPGCTASTGAFGIDEAGVSILLLRDLGYYGYIWPTVSWKKWPWIESITAGQGHLSISTASSSSQFSLLACWPGMLMVLVLSLVVRGQRHVAAKGM